MKKKHPEHVNLERWLISYADFITLLFAFFVVMYAMANQDKAKIKQVVESIERTFFGPSGKIDTGTGKTINIMSNPSSIRGRVIKAPMGHTNAAENASPELLDIAKRIEESLSYQFQTTDLKDNIKLIYDERGLVVRMSASAIYRPGYENVPVKYLPMIDKIAKVLKRTRRKIRVEGHTSSEELNVDRFPTKWELSSARASWIIRYLIKRHNFRARQLSAAGYANAHPIAADDTEEGKSLNRRVEIVISNVRETK